MPILRGVVTFARFRATPPVKRPADLKRWLVRGLTSHAFEPIDRKSEDERAAGFVELEDADRSEFAVSHLFYGVRALFAWRVDQLEVPGSALKAELERWQAAFEKENGRRPGRSETSERRAAIRQMLRSKATPTTKVHDISWNLSSGQLLVWTSSRKIVEEIQQALSEALDLEVLPLGAGAKVSAAGGPDAQVSPTAELFGVTLPAAMEVGHGEA